MTRGGYLEGMEGVGLSSASVTEIENGVED